MAAIPSSGNLRTNYSGNYDFDAITSPGSNANRQIHDELMEQYQAGMNVRLRKERDWYMALQFLKGNHWVTWIQGRGILNPPMDAKSLSRPRLIYNLTRVQIETNLAYLLRQDPIFGVVPATGQAEDLAAALIARQVLYHYWQDKNCSERLERTGYWTMTLGKGLWKITWDPLAGPDVPVMDVQQPGQDEVIQAAMAGMPMPQARQVQMGTRKGGDVRLDLVSPFEFLLDPGAETLDLAGWALHTTMRPVAELQKLYPKFADQIRPESPDYKLSFAQRALQAFGGDLYRMPAEKLRRMEIFEWWNREKMMRVVATKTGILEAGPIPPGHDPIPFAEWGDMTIPGEYWHDGTAKDLLPLNKEVNKRISDNVDYANKFRAKWLAQEGSVSADQINNETGEVIEFLGSEPKIVTPPPLPSAAVEQVSMAREAIENSAASVAVLQGRVEGEVRSGRQVAYLGQYGETRISLKGKHLARFLERAGHLILELVKEYADEPRLGRIVGKNRKMEVIFFKGSDIRGNTSVYCETGSMLGYTREERFNKLMQMQSQGLIGNDKVLENLEIEDFNGILDDVATDRNNALQENESWRNGQPPGPARYFEDHRVHISIHNNFRKSGTYRGLSPQQQEAVDEHCRTHENFLVPPPPQGPQPGAPSPGGPPPSKAGGPPPMGGGIGPARPPGPIGPIKGSEQAQGLPPVPPVAPL